MIKRIVIISLIYAFLVTVITLTLSQKGDGFLIAIVILSVLYAFLIVASVYKKNVSTFKQKNNNLTYSTSGFKDLHKISTKPFLFGLENKIISDHEFYFDNKHFYAINKDNQTAKFNLKDITEISKTSVQINNHRIWQVKITHNNEEMIFKFAHNYTLWNKNFVDFYQKVEQLNPSVIKSKWSIWSM